MDGHAILLGIGNTDRGDDGAGRILARLLRDRAPAGVEIVEHDGEATSMLELLEGRRAAVIVDACRSGRPAGTVERFDLNEAPLPAAGFGLSTHGLGVDVALELARSLGKLPSFCVVYAIEGQSFETGATLSPAVAAAVHDIASKIVLDLTSCQGSASCTRHL